MVFSSSRDKTIKSWLVNDNNSIQLQCVYDGHELVVTSIDRNSGRLQIYLKLSNAIQIDLRSFVQKFFQNTIIKIFLFSKLTIF
jgi:WD40 repeat protein